MGKVKRIIRILAIVILIIAGAIIAWRNRPVPHFARWDMDSLVTKEISPLTPISTVGKAGTELARKWYLSEVFDKGQYLTFNVDGTFYLHTTENIDAELKEKLDAFIPSDSLANGTYSGIYKCYDVCWCGCTCDGCYGVILFDNQGNELSRCAVTYCGLDNREDFGISKIVLPNPYKDDVRSVVHIDLYK